MVNIMTFVRGQCAKMGRIASISAHEEITLAGWEKLV
jgi:hypothetical protein